MVLETLNEGSLFLNKVFHDNIDSCPEDGDNGEGRGDPCEITGLP